MDFYEFYSLEFSKLTIYECINIYTHNIYMLKDKKKIQDNKILSKT